MNNEKRKLAVVGFGSIGVCQLINSIILYGSSQANRIYWGVPLAVGVAGAILLTIAVYLHVKR
jgi:hypothetical protein